MTRTDRSFPRIDSDGFICWKTKNGLIHRLDGPAIIDNRGYQQWWEYHRFIRMVGPDER